MTDAVDGSLDIPLPGNVLQMEGTRLVPPAARLRFTASTGAECCGSQPGSGRSPTTPVRSALEPVNEPSYA